MPVAQLIASFKAVKTAIKSQSINLSRLDSDLLDIDYPTRKVLSEIQLHGANLGLTGSFAEGRLTSRRPTLFNVDDENSYLMRSEIYKSIKSDTFLCVSTNFSNKQNSLNSS